MAKVIYIEEYLDMKRHAVKKRVRKRRYPKGYDSKFEYDLHCNQLRGCTLHPDNLWYTSHHTYEIDFSPVDDPDLIIEAKGRFRTSSEAKKYLDIIRCNPDKRLVFIFANPNTPMPGARRRADGTKFRMIDWAEKNGIELYTPETTPKEWRKK